MNEMRHSPILLLERFGIVVIKRIAIKICREMDTKKKAANPLAFPDPKSKVRRTKSAIVKLMASPARSEMLISVLISGDCLRVCTSRRWTY
ncbi:hypothetical protein EVAR_95857_1 [Eumeta japonica]|uniref:Uncharacterized protein n=1 Tax=Eumeta variegata TaxID=151549 RepID=A0A4C1VNQ5_EUMVA|nr:hypothetical protein EVAR_95857_1 [Eumeta japonica]